MSETHSEMDMPSQRCVLMIGLVGDLEPDRFLRSRGFCLPGGRSGAALQCRRRHSPPGRIRNAAIPSRGCHPAIHLVVVPRETTVRALQPVVFLLRVTHRIFGCAQFLLLSRPEAHLPKIGQRDLHQPCDIGAFAQQR